MGTNHGDELLKIEHDGFPVVGNTSLMVEASAAEVASQASR
jgi:hypothetical protein